MVVKTEVCSFSGFKIYPGHGAKYCRVAEKLSTYINGKAKASAQMRRKAAKLNWTQLYRRVNKKGIQEEAIKRRARKVNTVIMKPVEGASLEVIKAKRSQMKQKTDAAKEANLKEIKARKAAAKAAQKKANPMKGRGAGGPQAPPPKKR